LPSTLSLHDALPILQIGPQPQAITPHVVIVLDAVLVALEPRLGIEPRHPHIERRLAGVTTGIRGAELGMLEHRGIELDHVDVVRSEEHTSELQSLAY